MAEHIGPANAQAFERGQELLAHERHALDEWIVGAARGGIQCAVEVVQHVKETGDERSAAALHVFRQFLAEPGARLVEFIRRTPVLGDELLQLGVLCRELAFELLDVSGFEPGFFSFGGGFAAGPPAAVVHFEVGHEVTVPVRREAVRHRRVR